MHFEKKKNISSLFFLLSCLDFLFDRTWPTGNPARARYHKVPTRHTRHEFPMQRSSLWWRRFIGALTLTGQIVLFCALPVLRFWFATLWWYSLGRLSTTGAPRVPASGTSGPPKKGVATACCVPATRRPDRRPERNQLSSMPQALPRRRGVDGAHEAHPQGSERLRSCQ